MGFVAFDDPRLLGPVRPAALGDPETIQAIAALRKALLGHEHGVLSALCLGFSVNVLGLRTASGPVAFLNPRLVSAHDFGVHDSEAFVLTESVRRNVIRPRRIVVAGQRETGEEASFTSDGTSAAQALQHLELIAGDVPLRWLSPTERLMLDPVLDPTLRQSLRALYSAVNGASREFRAERQGRAVLSIPCRSGADVAGTGLVAAASLAATADFHLRDPILPVTPSTLLLFAFSAATPRRQLIAVIGSTALPVAVSLKHLFPQTVFDLALPADPMAANGLAELRLRPDDRLRLISADLQTYESKIGRNEVDAVLVDLTGAEVDVLPAEMLDRDFRSLSRVSRGEGGMVLVACPNRSEGIETALKGTFVHVACWAVDGHGVVYLAAKRQVGPELVLGRIGDLGLKIQNPALRGVLAAKVTHLGKDGKDRDAAQ